MQCTKIARLSFFFAAEVLSQNGFYLYDKIRSGALQRSKKLHLDCAASCNEKGQQVIRAIGDARLHSTTCTEVNRVHKAAAAGKNAEPQRTNSKTYPLGLP